MFGDSTPEEFAEIVEKKYGDSKHGEEYRKIIELIRLRLDR
jgi:hypothetical protein